ncbi:MAG: pentapeptide repeat-containing protein [Aliarcobacter sp.]|jgi:uncharacterized protein YjbI with pentapeptide repeats|uniref:Pentapeptide repeat-containing protein n=2 Tax=Aliarcobacter cryaerophilus TaxID=28198 RepID=A0A2S9T4C7_9BACT|nr:pentapeptide repeat-containing protein [Aliarcobacter cryaerophilus]MCT7473734.1 pentapeptide repeat-containing protein [Aliarcobacter cryaerophilus]PRM93676.1 hypothetical protein CJ673_09380 [Aliarcobacter cryaerophilus]
MLKIIKKNITFKDKNFSNIENEIKNDLTKFETIKFIDCTFSNCFSDDLIINKNCELIFEKCTIQGEFRHIFCESIIFKDSEIEKYYFNNPSEDKIKIKDLLFFNSKIDNLELEGVVLKKQLIKNNNNIKEKFKEIKSLILKNCSIEKNFIIDSSERKKENDSKRFKIKKLDLTNSTFEKDTKVKIQFCDVNDAIFYNTKFKDLADFYQSKFEKVNFERTDFEKISVFSESEFNCNLDFKYTKFLGKAIFRDTIVSGKFDLRNSIFDAEANFLDITSKSRKKYDEITNDYKFIGEPTDINVANRETARIIKNFYDNSNNIIEANRFYKLEMKKRMEEYNSLKKSDYRTFERLIFILHEWSSNHSQNWFLPFFWIVSLTFGYSLFACDFTNNSINNKIILDLIELTFDTTGVVTITFIINCIILAYLSYLILEKDNVIIHPILIYLLVSFYMLYVYFSSDLYLKSFANSLNPFSLMTGSEKITILGLCYKIAIAYLIYQLIVSIRQNTRRK